MSPSQLIDGVVIKVLQTHTDERGFFREIIRVTDVYFDHPFGQWSHSRMKAGVIKAWHKHLKQTDYFYVASGLVRVGLCDQRAGSKTEGAVMDLRIGDQAEAIVVKVPAGVAHGVKALTDANLLYLMSHTYDPSDEIRLPQDLPGVAFDWKQEGQAER